VTLVPVEIVKDRRFHRNDRGDQIVNPEQPDQAS
jgi:hypothetical protein